ncbi:hypothetical protein [Acidihalobacter prosperus]|uniref:DsrE family protein n=1 Tax=Acidihalobacter prosperus TaxID=160660 RepID=A0A1A6C7G9_9GAMM|nr:hypothetical protein [Acidihalobacter prosperus]OBS10494.1 hypothetical protein Thpro_020210 [Acidihalobacter prosperus]
MELMYVVSSRDARALLPPLLRATRRRGIEWGAFFTGEGAAILGDAECAALLSGAARAVVCEHSWQRHGDGESCPIELGSQTDHSAMIARTYKVISL